MTNEEIFRLMVKVLVSILGWSIGTFTVLCIVCLIGRNLREKSKKLRREALDLNQAVCETYKNKWEPTFMDKLQHFVITRDQIESEMEDDQNDP